MKKTILLTGAFGSVGYETLQLLIKNYDEYNIKILEIKTKKNVRLYNKIKENVTIFYEDITDGNDYKHILRDVDFVIHLAAIIPPLADKKTALAKKVNFEGTVHLVSQMKKYAKDAFLLYASSISIYGDRVNFPLILVSDPLRPSDGDYYAKTKIMAENYITSSGINYAIFRFSAIMSPKAKMDPLFFHMPLNTSMEIATTRDTAYALVEAIKHQDELRYKTFNLSGGKTCRIVYKEFLSRAFSLSRLGKFNLPKLAFAKKNFHCGYYADSARLNNILHFQRDSIDDYFKLYKKSLPKLQLFFTSLFKNVIKKNLLKKSDPLLSIRNKNILLQKRFYGYEL